MPHIVLKSLFLSSFSGNSKLLKQLENCKMRFSRSTLLIEGNDYITAENIGRNAEKLTQKVLAFSDKQTLGLRYLLIQYNGVSLAHLDLNLAAERDIRSSLKSISATKSVKPFQVKESVYDIT